MSDVKTCPNCKNVQARGKFCSQCGHDLSGVTDKPLIVATHRDYEGLRFVSSMLTLFGWLIIFAAVATSFVYYSRYTVSGDAIIRSGEQSDVPLYDPNKIVSPWVPVNIALFGVTSGVVTIAVGQLIMVFLDIRDDVRSMKSRE